MLELKNISKSFKNKKVLDNINLKVERNEVVIITGKSGEGKTTLLNIIAGLITPDRGKIYFNGKRIIHFLDIHTAYLRNRYFGFVFQTFKLLPEETVMENIFLPARIKGRINKSLALDLLKDVGLLEVKDMKAGLLSGGQKQRLALARALINSPSLILADEPTANLDKETAKEILNLLKNISSKSSIILVTHDEELMKFSDKRYLLRNGILEKV